MTKPQPPAIRLGPRPLAMHLALATMTCAGSNIALPLLKSGSTHWNPALQETAAALAAAIERADGEGFKHAVEREARGRLERFLTGVEQYRAHRYHRALDDPEPIWTDGNARLLKFGEDGPAVLLVASLVNRSYILDLGPQRSFARWLAGRGFRCYLLDWQAPGVRERSFTLDDYIAGPLSEALDATLADSGGRAAVLGYCMGGLLALALALRRQSDVTSLVFLATPWDFHAGDPSQVHGLAAAMRFFEPQLQALGELPTDALQYLFCALDPFLCIRKFTAFAGMQVRSEAAKRFVALEDWLNDGVPLAARVARASAFEWYEENRPARGVWEVQGEPVRPESWEGPVYVVIPAADRIVPPASAEALANAMPQATVKRPRAGHIGMIAGRGVTRSIWSPLADWLAAQS